MVALKLIAAFWAVIFATNITNDDSANLRHPSNHTATAAERALQDTGYPIFVGNNNMVIMEVESVPVVAPWVEETAIDGHSGTSYYRFDGNSIYGGSPSGRLSYFFEVPNAGTYRLIIRSLKTVELEGGHLGNDYYTKIVGLDGYDQDIKTFVRGEREYNSWLWETRLEIDHDNGVFTDAVFQLQAGKIYELQIAGRSKEFHIDRIAIFNTRRVNWRFAANLEWPESARKTTDDGGDGSGSNPEPTESLEISRLTLTTAGTGADSVVQEIQQGDVIDLTNTPQGWSIIAEIDTELSISSVSFSYNGFTWKEAGAPYAMRGDLSGAINEVPYLAFAGEKNVKISATSYSGASGSRDLSFSIVDSRSDDSAPITTTNPIPAPTDSPVAAPVPAPTKYPSVTTVSPVVAPTYSPVAAPVPAPTNSPVVTTVSPVAALTESPVAAPVPAPTGSPSVTTVSPVPAQVAAPTESPVAALVPAPTDSPVVAPAPEPSDSPVLTAVASPTDSPAMATDSPVTNQTSDGSDDPESTTTIEQVEPVTPTAPPTADEDPLPLCFSGDNLVMVHDSRVMIRMDELKIGDSVLTSTGNYARVYSFSHFDRENTATFLQLYAKGLSEPLEITDDHMVFVNGGATIRAKDVQIGDFLGDNEVTSLGSVQRQGLYAPVTTSGDLVVSGVTASCFVALMDLPPVVQHMVAHTALAPLRWACRGNFDICLKERYTEGISNYVYGIVYLVRYMSARHALCQISLVLVSAPVLVLFFFIEQMASYHMVILALLGLWFASKRYGGRRTKCKTL